MATPMNYKRADASISPVCRSSALMGGFIPSTQRPESAGISSTQGARHVGPEIHDCDVSARAPATSVARLGMGHC
jgi:hypothetical protein